MRASIWPALDLAGAPFPRRLEIRRAVWGKVHGAASDFRWIAASPGMDPQGRRLERELVLGSEDMPERAAFWRTLQSDQGTSHLAISCYPSRAMDAARRSGFLEKQILEWIAPGDAPAALGALVLLPEVARLTDEIWWQHAGDSGWLRPEFSLVLGDADAQPVDVTADLLEACARRGLEALQSEVHDEAALASFYADLLANRRPALLSGLARPLSPEAMAALLLPLPRSLADRLSLAGWMVSKRFDSELFRGLWDVLICQEPPLLVGDIFDKPGPDHQRLAETWALAVLSGDSPSEATEHVVLPSPSADAPELGTLPAAVLRLAEFAEDESRRWLDPKELLAGEKIRGAEACTDLLRGWIDEAEAKVENLRGATGVRYWEREHLSVKADLLRAAALALAPRLLSQMGLPRTTRVPALLFGSSLPAEEWDRLAALGEDGLAKAIRQSFRCTPDFFGSAMRGWLDSWRKRTRVSFLGPILERELG